VSFCVYILQCCDGSYYTGYTNNLQERTKQHLDGKGARYTRVHKPQLIAYVEHFSSRGEAMKREREIKRLSHRKKFDLITSQVKK
jgi:putative endonuclease